MINSTSDRKNFLSRLQFASAYFIAFALIGFASNARSNDQLQIISVKAAKAGELLAIQKEVKKNLLDPESAQFTNVFLSNVKDKEGTLLTYVCGMVNSKNRFGGYVGSRAFYGMLINKKFGVIAISEGKGPSYDQTLIETCSEVGLLDKINY